MGSVTNPQGQTAAKNQINQFLGNLGPQGYIGEDSAANAAMDAHEMGTEALYGTLAVAAGETGLMPGPIDWTGNAVNVMLGVVTAPSAPVNLQQTLGTISVPSTPTATTSSNASSTSA